jgi:hypothetical protein
LNLKWDILVSSFCFHKCNLYRYNLDGEGDGAADLLELEEVLRQLTCDEWAAKIGIAPVGAVQIESR